MDAPKADVEIHKRNSHFFLVMSPVFYTGSVRDKSSNALFRNYEGDKISGFGLGLLGKYRFTTAPDGWYISYGLTGGRFLIDYSDEGLIGYTQDNLHYYEYRNFSSGSTASC